MSLKKRLIVSNAAIIVIPVLITLLFTLAFVSFTTSVLGSGVSYENMEKLARIKYEFLIAGETIWKEKPDTLAKTDFQQYLTAKLSGIAADVVVVKNHESVYSTIKINSIDIEKCLDIGSEGFLNNSIKLNGISYLLYVHPFIYPDDKQGHILLLAPVDKGSASAEKLILWIPLIFLISFLTTNAIFSLVLSRSIVSPLSRLQTAAGEISRGNLNHTVIEEGDDEIRQLCRSFEQMRIKLKESVHAQMKYDDNRKMLISSISHDLKTPITSIKGYVEGIMDGVANTPDKVEKYLRTVYAKAIQVDAMIDDLLLCSKLDLNQIPFHFEKTDIIKYFEDCVAENEAEFEKTKIRVTFTNEISAPCHVMMDRDRMKRVVINLLDNARKYMNKSEGRIILLLRETATTVIIEIQDTGAGITKENLPFIFDRFYRSDTARSKAGGSGLGLAIAKQIVEGHGGKIWARSQENEGTRIMFSLNKSNSQEE